MNVVHSFLVSGKSFDQTYKDIEKRANNGSMLSKRYPFKKPSSPQLKGQDGIITKLVLCIGVGIKQNASNDCRLRPDGVLVWSERTLVKLDGSGGELQFALQLMQFLYSMMMGGDDIAYGVPFQHYLGR